MRFRQQTKLKRLWSDMDRREQTKLRRFCGSKKGIAIVTPSILVLVVGPVLLFTNAEEPNGLYLTL
jgi:hypothetical protein